MGGNRGQSLIIRGLLQAGSVSFSLSTFDLGRFPLSAKIYLRSMGSGATGSQSLTLFCSTSLFLPDRCALLDPLDLILDQTKPSLFPDSPPTAARIRPEELAEKERRPEIVRSTPISSQSVISTTSWNFCEATSAESGIPQIIVQITPII